jgi:hypothetical protein
MSKSIDVHSADDDTGAGDDDAPADKPTAASVAAYIAELAAELATMAERADLTMLCYFLRLARVEAESRAQELASPAPTVDGSGRA